MGVFHVFLIVQMVPDRSTLHIFKYFFCGHAENGLKRKLRLILKFMTSSTGELTITIHKLSSISRR